MEVMEAGFEEIKTVGKRLSATKRCPNCGAGNLEVFYEVDNIPVHSNLMLNSRQEALAFPKGNLALGFCRRCGFISNVKFNVRTQDYSTIYEDQQSYSATFNAFSDDLVSRLIATYGIHGKNILEIGCGKGDFLLRMCELGDNQGIGIDPTAVPERIPEAMQEKVSFIQDYYSKRYAEITCDLLMCRHTLEHIHPTAAFLSTVRSSIGHKPDTLVFFEVPDMGRVLSDLAFWDIYYEHCSYFTSSSLSNLFYNCGFEILDLDFDFDDQYLLCVAKPVKRVLGWHKHEVFLSVDVKFFEMSVEAKIGHWRDYLRQLSAAGKKVVIWGSGSKCVAFLTTLGIGEEFAMVVDINPHRHGKFIPGLGIEIQSPQSLPAYQPDVVIIMNPVYKPEIQKMLDGMGVESKVMTVLDL